jgi:hypothetical protein
MLCPKALTTTCDSTGNNLASKPTSNSSSNMKALTSTAITQQGTWNLSSASNRELTNKNWHAWVDVVYAETGAVECRSTRKSGATTAQFSAFAHTLVGGKHSLRVCITNPIYFGCSCVCTNWFCTNELMRTEPDGSTTPRTTTLAQETSTFSTQLDSTTSHSPPVGVLQSKRFQRVFQPIIHGDTSASTSHRRAICFCFCSTIYVTPLYCQMQTSSGSNNISDDHIRGRLHVLTATSTGGCASVCQQCIGQVSGKGCYCFWYTCPV